MTDFYPPAADIEIMASVEAVWAVLLNGVAYPERNRFIVQVKGDLQEEGLQIPMQVRLRQRTVRPSMKVVTVEPPGQAGSGARWVHQYDSALARLGWLTSERHHEMSPLEDGTKTLYKTWEPFGG